MSAKLIGKTESGWKIYRVTYLDQRVDYMIPPNVNALDYFRRSASLVYKTMRGN